MSNIVADAEVGLLFFIPGIDDTLRINGRARLIREAPFFDEKSRIETIYLAALSRMPTQKELEKAQSFIAKFSTGADPKKAYKDAVADLFWALINSSEFVFNH